LRKPEVAVESIRVDKDEAHNALQEGSGGGISLLTVVVAVVAVAGAIWFWWQWHSAASVPASIEVPPVTSAPPLPIAPPVAEEPPIQHPLEIAEKKPPEPLPALDESDGAVAAALIALVGDKPFASLFVPEMLIRHFVATVDNLPREQAPVKMWPLRPAGSWMETTSDGENLAVGPKNSARYGTYIKVVKALDAQRLAAAYRRFYPLFQEAYRDLGYPKGYFNDRLVAAIDDMLATPEPKEPLHLVQDKVRYEFADPDLAHRSAGQKLLLRMGVDNARVVKAKLRDFRQYIARR
jgi:hypothetical protein